MADDRELALTFIAAFALGMLVMYLKRDAAQIQNTSQNMQPVYAQQTSYEPPSIAIEESEAEVVITNTEEIKPEFDEKGRIVGMIIMREVKRVSG